MTTRTRTRTVANSRLLPPRDAAARIGRRPRTLYDARACRRLGLEPVVVKGRRFFRESDILRLLGAEV
jgi:hypothetical protein